MIDRLKYDFDHMGINDVWELSSDRTNKHAVYAALNMWRRKKPREDWIGIQVDVRSKTILVRRIY